MGNSKFWRKFGYGWDGVRGIEDGFRMQWVMRGWCTGGHEARLAGEAWLIEAVPSHPELSSRCCSSAKLFSDSGIWALSSKYRGARRKSEEESEVMKLITPDSFSTVDWSSFTECSSRGTSEASSYLQSFDFTSYRA